MEAQGLMNEQRSKLCHLLGNKTHIGGFQRISYSLLSITKNDNIEFELFSIACSTGQYFYTYNLCVQSWEAVPPDTSAFTPDITPLVLAAHTDNYEVTHYAHACAPASNRVPHPHPDPDPDLITDSAPALVPA